MDELEPLLARAQKGDLAVSGRTPAALMETKETRAQVQSALRALLESEREAAALFYIGAYSHKEIAALLDVAASTINNRLHAARTRLKEEFVKMTRGDLHMQRPSKHTEFVQGVLRPVMSREEPQALEELHEKLVPLLANTFSEVTGKKAKVAVG